MLVGPHKMRSRCALCSGSDLERVLSLPPTPLANEFVKPEDAVLYGEQEHFPLDLVMCEVCKHVQVEELVDPARMFRNYVYVTGTSTVTVQHFKKYAEEVCKKFEILENPHRHGSRPRVVEIGSNDGTLLKEFSLLGCQVLGVDPATKIVEDANKAGVPTICGFFTPTLADAILDARGPADLVVANNVLAHTPDIESIVIGARKLITRSGVFVVEVSYLRDIVVDGLFDTIYHEHFSYHAVKPLRDMMARVGLRLFDAVVMPDQKGRGSLRVYACPEDSTRLTMPSVDTMCSKEEKDGLFNPSSYIKLGDRISTVGEILRGLLGRLKQNGKTVAGYGAPAKLTTLMHAFNLDRRHVDFVVDDSEWKQGLLTPGTHIPVMPPSELEAGNVDACIVFAWNFADDILARHRTKVPLWIVPLPEVTVHEKKPTWE